ncbi:MAG: macro domain-containing protein [Bacteroidetes Order II. Incertae sedis bacterium]|nr:macro domain-containing protein [Bacteroidetes Order II. bacterium]
MNPIVLSRYVFSSNVTLEACIGDLTEERSDLIVNAANGRLRHGGGVAGAIIAKGGKEIQTESTDYVREHGTIPVGGVVVTGAGNLPTKGIIHTVGPVWMDGKQNEDAFLAAAVLNTLQKADDLGATSLSLPAISSGIFAYPVARCATVIVGSIISYFKTNPKSTIRRIRIVDIQEETAELFAKVLMALDN